MLVPAMPSIAQVFTIAEGNINTCTGAFLDSGGQGATGYQNNESFVSTICPDVPGDAITVSFPTFNLSAQGPNPIDVLTIYDGNSTSAPTIGSYTGTELQGYNADATFFNTSGCLTFEFTSNANGTGVFAGSITCYTPCDPPVAIGTMSEAIPALVCVGETVQFEGSLSTATAPFNVVSWEWDFDDGSAPFQGAVTSHSFSEPGEYVVQLNILDDNGCGNVNLVDLQVLVSTTPSFEGTVESLETCLGATVDLSAMVSPTTWTGLPENNFGDGIYMPDDPGACFNNGLAYSLFDPGQTLNDMNDLLGVCVSMEHSYMGDLIINLICPNGQSVIVHQQGGGGTFLGDALDGETDPPISGTCWDYCWSPTATSGTWVDNSGNGSLPAGTYESLNPMSALLGCPLNGTWTFQVCDMWGADDGFACSWNMNFDPSIIPEATQFTPDVGTATLDSAAWSGPDLAFDATNPLFAQATPSLAGTYNYTFNVTDNFGCTYDTLVTISIPELPLLEAGEPIVLCNDPEPMTGQITANGPPSSCAWELVLYETFGDSWNGGANLAATIDGVTTNYSVPNGSIELTVPLAVQNGSTITLTYTAGTIFNNENSFTLFDDTGAEVFASPNGPLTGLAYTGEVFCGGGLPFTFVWTPVGGLTDPMVATTDVFVTEPTMFYLSTYLAGHPECAVTDSVLVSPDLSINAGLSLTMVVCASDLPFLLTDSLGGTPDLTGVWTDGTGSVIDNTLDPASAWTDVYTYTITSGAGCVATSTLDITIIPADDPTCCGVIDAGLPSISCDLTNVLEALRGNSGVGNWTGPAGAVYGDAFSDTTTVTMPLGGGGTHMFYWVENDGAFCNLIDSVVKTFTDPYVFTPTLTNALCYTFCDGAATMQVTGGNSLAGLTFDWSTGVNGVNANAISTLCAGSYVLTVTDDNGCQDSTTITITEPVLLELDSMATQPVTCSGYCDGQVEIYDAEAVQYSIDDGDNWSTTGIFTDACEAVYELRITNADGCIGADRIIVTGPPPVVADFDWGPKPANVNDPTIKFSNLSTDAVRYFWNIADLVSSTEIGPTYRFDYREPDSYEVCLIAYNFNECSDTICRTVVIDDVLFTYIPNSFTPDGDDRNDVWGISVNVPVITDFEMMVFDRWGQMVYETNDPYKPWLGSYQNGGEVLKSDVYAYRILYGIKNTDARKELIGHVTLIK